MWSCLDLEGICAALFFGNSCSVQYQFLVAHRKKEKPHLFRYFSKSVSAAGVLMLLASFSQSMDTCPGIPLPGWFLNLRCVSGLNNLKSINSEAARLVLFFSFFFLEKRILPDSWSLCSLPLSPLVTLALKVVFGRFLKLCKPAFFARIAYFFAIFFPGQNDTKPPYPPKVQRTDKKY